MFSVEQRDALLERVLGLGREDERVIAGAVVGSLAVDGGDRFSDVDLTFGIACHVGLRTKGGTQGVGKSTTVAVVAGSVAVIAADFFVTQILVRVLY